MSNNSKSILRFWIRYSNMKDKVNQIKEDEVRRQSSIYFGVTSILTSLVAAAFCIFGSWFFNAFLDSGLVIFTIIIGVGLIACGVILFVWALIRMLFQFRINKKWISWLSLVIFLGGLIASGVLVVVMMSGQ